MSELKQVDGRLVPMSPADLAQRAEDAADRKAERVLIPWPLVLVRVLLAGGAQAVDALSGIVKSRPDLLARILATREGLYQDDPDAAAVLRAAGLDPAEVLR
jgi:hypothetical protein